MLKRFLAISLLAACSSAIARPAQPLKNIEVYGQVTLNGQAVADVLVEAKTGSCFGELNGSTKTNKHGSYSIKLKEFFHTGGLHVSVPSVKAAHAGYAPYCKYEAANVDYKSNQTVRYNVSLSKAQPETAEQRQCLAQGGQWGPFTPTKMNCNFTYKDYGQSCKNGSECLAKVCLANPRYIGLGYCPMNTYYIWNSSQRIENGKRIPNKP